MQTHFMPRSADAEALCRQRQFLSTHLDGAFQTSFLPFLEITDEASPGHAARLGKRELIVGRRVRLQTNTSMRAPVLLWKCRRAWITFVLLNTIKAPFGR